MAGLGWEVGTWQAQRSGSAEMGLVINRDGCNFLVGGESHLSKSERTGNGGSQTSTYINITYVYVGAYLLGRPILIRWVSQILHPRLGASAERCGLCVSDVKVDKRRTKALAYFAKSNQDSQHTVSPYSFV